MVIELGGSVFEFTHDLVGDLFRAKNAGVTRGLQCEAALVLFIQRRLRYKQSRFIKIVLWLKFSLYILSLRMNCWNTLLMTR
jgi:hypothetical protein